MDGSESEEAAEKKKDRQQLSTKQGHEEDPGSVSGIVDFANASAKKLEKLPHFIKPMLAKEAGNVFDDKDWVFEIKWDGYRAIAEKQGSRILLYSRNGISFQKSFPVVADQLKKIPADAVLDGEIVVLDEEGRPDFQFLQHYSENQGRPIRYYIFDLLELNGEDTKELPLTDRKQLLQKLIPGNPVIKYCDHIREKGTAFLKLAKEKDLEGIMAKKMDSRYFEGKRSSCWLKIKNHKTSEAIIAGYSAPSGSRKYFGALILAAMKDHQFTWIGNAGTGFNDQALKEVYDLLQPLVQQGSPFRERIKNTAGITWVKPELICEVRYSEITADGKLRHPVFLHLRTDKTINEINMDPIQSKKRSSSKDAKAVKKKTPAGSPAGTGENSNDPDKIYTFGKNKVKVTHPDKIYFPEEEITKGDVAAYYISMAGYLLPYLKGRPESLLRHPNGIHAQSFFQKDAADNTPSYVKRLQVYSESAKKEINYIVCDNIETLVYLNNLGCIELNPWHSTVKSLDKPDYLMIDIDPSDANTFEQVTEVALTVKKILDQAGAEAFCKTSGASGMHIFIPAGKKYTYEQVKDFAFIVCTMVNEELKEFTTLERNLQKRGSKHIYLDYLQNRRGQTIASVYSLRPKPGATVSTPLLWEEVRKGISPKQFTIHNTLQRVEKMGDIFKGVLGKGIDLKRCLENL